MKQRMMIGVILAAVMVAAIFFVVKDSNVLAVVGIFDAKPVLVIDPGHGGIDGGAQSKGGICEKNINLSIAMKIKQQAEISGWKVIMTRDADEGLYTQQKGSIRSKKNEDLTNRQKIIKKTEGDLAISIHLNSFPDQSCKGAQVFYPKNSKEGKAAAALIQAKLGKLDPNNKRTSLTKDNVAIMKNHTAPMVLVECGFLSNEQEEKLLKQEPYQQALADAIFRGIKEYFIDTGKIQKSEIVLSWEK